MTSYVLVFGVDSEGLEVASDLYNYDKQMGYIHLHGLFHDYDFISQSYGYYHW